MFSQPQKQLSSNIPLVVDVSGTFITFLYSTLSYEIEPFKLFYIITGRGIRDVSQIPGGGREVAALTADNNKLTSLNGIHAFTSLIQVSIEYVVFWMCSGILYIQHIYPMFTIGLRYGRYTTYYHALWYIHKFTSAVL